MKSSKSKGLTPKLPEPLRLSGSRAIPTGWACPKCDGVNAPSVLACPCSTARPPSGPTKNVRPAQRIDEVIRTLRYHVPGLIS